ncbi:MAG: FG-GAP-like repeat-containing protein, partial [Deltaproteobacteria bacterium]|nr:FG-GAP-like repeat-containing protein [Deltaproteobacteria bacterium]
PLDSKVEPKANGGSQRLRWAVTQGTSVEVVEGHALRGMRTGRARLRGEDEFSGASLELTVEVGMRLNVDSTYAGDRSEATRILAHDLNGDGVDEAIVTMPLSNLHHLRAGAVLVYRGTSEGWHSPPAFVATGEAIDDQFGSSIAVGDGDGRKDLLVGAWQADQSGMNSGGVFLFKGADGDGFFQPRPEQSFAGIAGWDRLGASMVLCDLDGDRDLDLVMAAPDAESRDRRAQNQGALYVHPNVGGRLLGAAVQTIYGEIPEPGGGSRLHNDLRLGMRMASGDFNGDGKADLAIGAPGANTRYGTMAGMVQVVAGNESLAMMDQGDRSVLWLATNKDNAGFGFGVAAVPAPLGRAEIAVSQVAPPDVYIFYCSGLKGDREDEISVPTGAERVRGCALRPPRGSSMLNQGLLPPTP